MINMKWLEYQSSLNNFYTLSLIASKFTWTFIKLCKITQEGHSPDLIYHIYIKFITYMYS